MFFLLFIFFQQLNYICFIHELCFNSLIFCIQDPNNHYLIILLKKLKFCSLFQVSWVRHRDIHLLTVGRYTYTSDQRFEAIHSPHTEDWTLRIRYPQRKDSGIYECQISTTPPVGHPVYLTVVGM